MVKALLFFYGIVVASITITICLELFCIAYDCDRSLSSTHATTNRVLVIICLIWGSWLIIVLYNELQKALNPFRGRHVMVSHPPYKRELPTYRV